MKNHFKLKTYGVGAIIILGLVTVLSTVFFTEDTPPTLELDGTKAFIGTGTYLTFKNSDFDRFEGITTTYTSPAGVHAFYSDEDLTVEEIMERIKPDRNLKIMFARYEPEIKKFQVYPKGDYIKTDILSDDEISEITVKANHGFFLIGSIEFEVVDLKPFTQEPSGNILGFPDLNDLQEGWNLISFRDLKMIKNYCGNRVSAIWLSNLNYFDKATGDEISKTLTSQFDSDDLFTEEAFVKDSGNSNFTKIGWMAWVKLIGDTGTCSSIIQLQEQVYPGSIENIKAEALSTGDGFQVFWKKPNENFNDIVSYRIAYAKTSKALARSMDNYTNFSDYVDVNTTVSSTLFSTTPEQVYRHFVVNPFVIRPGDTIYLSVFALNESGYFSNFADEVRVVMPQTPDVASGSDQGSNVTSGTDQGSNVTSGTDQGSNVTSGTDQGSNVRPSDPTMSKPIFTIPGQVQGLRASVQNTDATLSWTKLTDTEFLKIKGYKIYYGKESGALNPSKYTNEISVSNVSTYVVSGLDTSTRYYFAVVGVGENNRESVRISNEASVTTGLIKPVNTAGTNVCMEQYQLINNEKDICNYKSNGSTEFKTISCDGTSGYSYNVYAYSFYCSGGDYKWKVCNEESKGQRSEFNKNICDDYEDSPSKFAWKGCVDSRQGEKIGNFVCDSGVWRACSVNNEIVGEYDCVNGEWENISVGNDCIKPNQVSGDLVCVDGKWKNISLTGTNFTEDQTQKVATNLSNQQLPIEDINENIIGKLSDDGKKIYDGSNDVTCSLNNEGIEISDKVCSLISYSISDNYVMDWIWAPANCPNDTLLSEVSTTSGKIYSKYSGTKCVKGDFETFFRAECSPEDLEDGASLCGEITSSSNKLYSEICNNRDYSRPSDIMNSEGGHFICWTKDNEYTFLNSMDPQVYLGNYGVLYNEYYEEDKATFNENVVLYGGGINFNQGKYDKEFFTCGENNLGEHLKYREKNKDNWTYYTCIKKDNKYKWNPADDTTSHYDYSMAGVMINYAFREYRDSTNTRQDIVDNKDIDRDYFTVNGANYDRYKELWDSLFFCAGDGNGTWNSNYQCTSFKPTYVCNSDNVGEKINYFTYERTDYVLATNFDEKKTNTYKCSQDGSNFKWKK
ncbi:MAG: fibronectin type III domain-containing protein [Candidatus Gracilibacteria bacterium]|jgi:hypothetical protein|nr:fibronectin type III domain-containing protein [Candidatus Gracilibacteria bacterium]